MGGVIAPVRAYMIEPTIHSLDMGPEIIEKIIYKDSDETVKHFQEIRSRLKTEGKNGLELRAENRRLESNISNLNRECNTARRICSEKEEMVKRLTVSRKKDDSTPEVYKIDVKTDKKMIVIGYLVALAAGIAIGVIV